MRCYYCDKYQYYKNRYEEAQQKQNQDKNDNSSQRIYRSEIQRNNCDAIVTDKIESE